MQFRCNTWSAPMYNNSRKKLHAVALKFTMIIKNALFNTEIWLDNKIITSSQLHSMHKKNFQFWCELWSAPLANYRLKDIACPCTSNYYFYQNYPFLYGAHIWPKNHWHFSSTAYHATRNFRFWCDSWSAPLANNIRKTFHVVALRFTIFIKNTLFSPDI